MPNTLAHLGVGGLASRALLPEADLKWVYLGCIVPDLPWIGQRICRAALPGIDPYDLRLYCIVQASLLFSLLLSLALASLSRRRARVFAILGLNCLVHLLLDTIEIKWANGVHLVAPLDWRLLTLRWFWPETWPIHLLSGIGLLFFAYSWRQRAPIQAAPPPRARRIGFVTLPLLLAYFTLPLAFLDGPAAADNHFVQTLRERALRPGRYVEIDRQSFRPDGPGPTLQSFAGEDIRLMNVALEEPSSVSLRGYFIDTDRIAVMDLHVHPSGLRDAASYLGLALIALYWGRALYTGLGSWRARNHTEQR